MRTRLNPQRRRAAGYTLALVLAFLTVGLLILGGALEWSSTNASLNDRNNTYFTTLAAAEAATEKVLAHLARDYQSQGESLVHANLDTYRLLVPTAAEDPLWAGFAFKNNSGEVNRTHVERIVAEAYTPLQSQYQGIYGLASTYRVQSNARSLSGSAPVEVGLRQDVQLASIPIFQFAIFYSMDLEINPGPNMNVTGRVHGNANLYMQPVNTLTFQSHVTASGQLVFNKHPEDPLSRNTNNSHVVFQGEHDANVGSITLPIGTNNTPEAVAAILDIPPETESEYSAMGKQRFYNKADLIVLVSNASVTVKSGRFNNFATTIPSSEWGSFVSTSASFYNWREAKTVAAVDIDVGKLKTWSETNTTLHAALGRDVRSIYVADMRSHGSGYQSGVRVRNGQTLPSLGLTVATPNPIYVQGHFNAPSAHLGTTNTSLTKPAALVGDAINILSTSWSDANSTASLSSRNAGNTTVNAALLGGIVPSGGGSYSGGVENFPRFLENWSGDTLTYNGSMVVMFRSRVATAPWGASNVYNPPTRNWAFDVNFMDSTKLPPGTPEARVLVRGEWAAVRPGTGS
ncbi:MAG TPA: hypothetical protein VNO52_14770 [Methylomirabilota bacterium]|nr:hypothetical protein [Methylomirabilota bacterium]